MTTEDKNCGTCKHSWMPPKPAPQQLGCRRFPPQTHFIMVLRGNPLAGRPPHPVEEQRSAFPAVHPSWACGEWAPLLTVGAA